MSGRIKENLIKAAEAICNGQLVAFPTETVYGLGADAFNEAAIKKIFEVKGRPFQDPLILHIADQNQLNDIAQDIPDLAWKIIEKFWPGPLTLILKKKSNVSSLLTADLNTVAVRMPRNIIALALIKNSKRIIAAPSANKFQSLSPTTADAVVKELGKSVDIILDGGPSLVGLESTILDLTQLKKGVKVLRWGGISEEQLKEIPELSNQNLIYSEFENVEGASKIAPGMMAFHYAPKKPFAVFKTNEISYLSREEIRKFSWLCFSNHEAEILKNKGAKKVSILSPGGNFEEAAQNYFESLRKIDESDSEKIAALEFKDVGLGRSINERLYKARHGGSR